LHVKPTWNKKMRVLSTFLESSLNFLPNNMENTTKFSTVREKSGVKVLKLPETQLERTETKSPVKPTWSKKITVLSTFLESSLNFLSNNMEDTTKFGTVREKSGVKFLNYHSLKEQRQNCL